VGGGTAGGERRIGRVRLAIGVALLLGAAGLYAQAVQRGLNVEPDRDISYGSEELQTPVDTTLGLRAGGYYVYENTGPERPRTDEFEPYRGVRDPTLTRDDVVVTGPDGDEVELEPGGGRTYGIGDDIYLAVAFLRVGVGEDGVYRLRVAARGPGTEVYVGDSGYSILFGRDTYAMKPVLLAIPVAGVGLGLVASAFTRRPREPVRAPPGWYPDPWGDQRLRWFDGIRWTEHLGAGPPSGPPAGPPAGPP
jgi:hypothetical protein